MLQHLPVYLLGFGLISLVAVPALALSPALLSPAAPSTTKQAPSFDRPDRPPSLEPLPEPQLPPTLPPVEEVLPAPEPIEQAPPELPVERVPDTITVERFEFEGNTAISNEALSEVVQEFVSVPITISQLYEARSRITQVYVEAGYVTSGAYIPPQRLQDGVVLVQIVEGALEAIRVEGTERLNPRYITSRLERAATPPLNSARLFEALTLLQLDPRIEDLRAELSVGPQFGTSLLTVEIVESDTFTPYLRLDNDRSPSVGSFRQRIGLTELNLRGFGEVIDVNYSRTDGSDALEGTLQTFLNARNGTLEISAGISQSEVIEAPFDDLNLESEANFFELTYRQPLIQTPTRELALGVTATRQENRSIFDLPDELGGAIPVTLRGADDNGRTRVSALRFFQEYTNQDRRQVFAVRSQFSLGLDVLDSTVNDDGRPDSRFFAWRGQTQYVRLLGEDILLSLRADLQLASESLLSLEQFGLGGRQSVRGYRQDVLLTDNGLLASAEIRIPIVRVRDINGILQVAPFVDFGTGWNSELENPDPNTLAGGGLGLLWQMDQISARLDWGIPFVEVETSDRTLQENGIYFSVGVGF